MTALSEAIDRKKSAAAVQSSVAESGNGAGVEAAVEDLGVGDNGYAPAGNPDSM